MSEYSLTIEPRYPDEALTWNALFDVVGFDRSFSFEEGCQVIANVLDISLNQAALRLDRLKRNDNVGTTEL